jgi:hypothetical protein
MKKLSRNYLTIAVAALLGGFAVAAQAQTVWSDNFDNGYFYPPNQNELVVSSSDLSHLANYSLTAAVGTGEGEVASQGLTWRADFLGSYTGWMQAQLGYSGGNPSGNTSLNLSDYTLSFDMDITSGVGLNHMQLNIQGWPGEWYGGSPMTQTGAQNIDTSAVTVGGGWQNITVNLGTLFGNATGFNPTDLTYQMQWQVNGWELAGGGPVTGEQITIDNVAITMVPEPSTLALIGLGAAGMLWLRRKNS